jgi:uncharacterized protein YbaR (Trm112 family)
LVAAIIAVILTVLFPLQYLANTAESNIDFHVDNSTGQISDTIRNKGYLDTATYESYVELLDSTGELYDIEIEDIHPVTGEEVSNNNDSDDMFTLSEHNTEEPLCSETNSFHEKVSLLQLSLNNKRYSDNSMPLAVDKEDIQSFATHTHTEDCYVGHRHKGECYVASDSTLTYVPGHSNVYLDIRYGGSGSNGWNPVRKIYVYCSTCNYMVASLIEYDGRGEAAQDGGGHRFNKMELIRYYYNGSNIVTFTTSVRQYLTSTTYKDGYHYNAYSRDYVSNTQNPIYVSGHTSLLNLYNNYRTLTQDQMKNNLNKVGYITAIRCPKCASTSGVTPVTVPAGSPILVCTQQQDENPLCSQVVTSITPTTPNQTVNKNGTIVSTATATYLDGHTGVVNCTSNFNANVAGVQTVTLTYTGLVGNAKTYGTRTCTIIVTVIDKNLEYIVASPTTQIINRYGTPTFSVTAYYSDGTSAAISYGRYTTSAFDSSMAGPKTITISYTENGVTKSTSVTVFVDSISYIKVVPNAITVERYTKVEAIPMTITATYLYSGSKVITTGYTISGYSPSVLGNQTATISYTDNGTTVTTTCNIMVTHLHKTCSRCGFTYDMNLDNSDPGCPRCKDLIIGITVSPNEMEIEMGGSLPITVQAEYNDGTNRSIYGWTSNFNPYKSGLQIVTVNYGGYAASITVWIKEAEIICPICGTPYPVSEENCPVCREKVVGISVSPEEITVNQNEIINLDVYATYADGRINKVEDWSIDCTSAKVGNFIATVTYEGISAQISLTVLSLSMVICPICNLSYDIGEYPNGCPVCSKIITGIEAHLTSGSNLVQCGTTPDISIVLIFRDTHREITSIGYILEDYDPFKLGMQTITVRYKEFHCSIDINVVDTLATVVCPNGHIYYLNEDGSDPGCPYCTIGGNYQIVYYYDITYIPEILYEIYTNGIYYFDKGNYITVRVTKKDVTLIIKIQKKLSLKTAMLGRKKRYVYGGEVL